MMKQPFARSALAFAITSALVTLTGCGSTSTETSGFDAITGGSEGDAYTLSGVAAKGIIQHGVIEVFELDANGNPLRSLGTTETDEDGKYQATLSDKYAGGPLLVKVKARAGTKMICDVQDGECEFGKPVDLDSDFEMDAISVPPESGKKIKIQITPLAEMAAARARALGALDRKNIKRALAEVGEIAGVDIMAVEPVDISRLSDKDSEEKKAYAAFLAGVGKIAMQKDKGGLKKGLEKFAESFKDGRLDDADEVKIADLISAVEHQASRSKVESTRLKGRVALIRATLENNNGVFAPEPGEASGKPPVAKAKALLKEVRSWAGSLQALENPLDSFGGDITLASDLIDADARVLLGTTGKIIDAVMPAFEAYLQSSATGEPQPLQKPLIVDPATGATISLAIVPTAEGVEILIDNPKGLAGVATAKLNLTTSLSASELAAMAAEKTVSLQALQFTVMGEIASSSTRLALQNVALDVELPQETTIDTAGDNGDIAIKTARLEGEIKLAALEKGITFSGHAAADLVAPKRDGGRKGLKKLVLGGDISATDGRSFEGSVTLDITDPATTGRDFIRGTLTARTALKLPGRPDATAILVAKRIGHRLGEAELTLAYNKRSLTIAGKAAGESPLKGKITFANPEGVKISLNGSGEKRKGIISVQGRMVGYIDEGAGGAVIAHFEDGSFETLY